MKIKIIKTMPTSKDHYIQLEKLLAITPASKTFPVSNIKIRAAKAYCSSYIFSVFPPRLEIYDLDKAFKDVDFLENALYRIIHCFINSGNVEIYNSVINNALQMLKELQLIHCELAKRLWHSQMPIFSVRANKITQLKTGQYRIEKEKYSLDELNALWRKIISRFTFSLKAKHLKESYLVHSLVLKLLSRPAGIFLGQLWAKMILQYEVRIDIKDGFSAHSYCEKPRFLPALPNKDGKCQQSKYEIVFPQSLNYETLINKGFSFGRMRDDPDIYFTLRQPLYSLAHEMRHVLDYKLKIYSKLAPLSEVGNFQWTNFKEQHVIERAAGCENLIAEVDYKQPVRVSHHSVSLEHLINRQKTLIDIGMAFQNAATSFCYQHTGPV